jgi:hypothetical protein
MTRRPRPSGLSLVLTAVVLAVIAAPSTAFAQCAMCGSATASSPGVARGLAYSIFFLLGTLALVVAWLVALVLRSQARPHRSAPPAPDAASIPALPAGHAPAEK